MYTLSRCTLVSYQWNISSIIWIDPFRCTPFPSVQLFPICTGLQILFKQRIVPFIYTVLYTPFPDVHFSLYQKSPQSTGNSSFQVYALSRSTLFPVRATIPTDTRNSSFGCTPFLGVHLFPIKVTIPPYTWKSSSQEYTLSRCTIQYKGNNPSRE